MKNYRLKRCLLSNMKSFDYNSMKLGHINYTILCSSFSMAHIACLQELLPFVNDNSLFIRILAIAGASVSRGHISSY